MTPASSTRERDTRTASELARFFRTSREDLAYARIHATFRHGGLLLAEVPPGAKVARS